MEMNESGANTKLAVLIEKVDNLEEKITHKLGNQQNQLKFIYDDISDIQNKIKYCILGAIAMYGLTTGGFVEFMKGLI